MNLLNFINNIHFAIFHLICTYCFSLIVLVLLKENSENIFLKILKRKRSFLIQCRDQLGSGYNFQFAQSHHQVLHPLSYRCKDETCRCSQIKKKLNCFSYNPKTSTTQYHLTQRISVHTRLSINPNKQTLRSVCDTFHMAFISTPMNIANVVVTVVANVPVVTSI